MEKSWKFIIRFLWEPCVCVLCASCGSSQCCITCSLLMRVEDTRADHMEEAYSRADHMEEAYSRAGLMTAL